MSTKKKNASSKGTRKKSPEIENLDQYVNNFEWVPIPNTRQGRYLVSPIEIEDNDMFIYFFKRFLMQPQIRKHFIHKYRPDIDYSLVKLDFEDLLFDKKVKYIQQKMKVKNQDYIIDIAEQLKKNGGGHWTSLKRENGELIYMDSDPFFYGSASNAFHDLVKNLPNPIEIYGDTNKNRSQYRANKSIQNLHKRDTFCQSWSLFFLTVSNMYPDNSERIRFQLKTPVTHQDTQAQYKNFPDFFDNFIFLLDVWIAMIRDDVKLETIVEESQWKNWNAADLVTKLEEIKTDFLEKEDKIKNDAEMQNDLFCLDKNAIPQYITKRKIENRK
jgi:hypothetical protein